jgi:hypothetical protein
LWFPALTIQNLNPVSSPPELLRACYRTSCAPQVRNTLNIEDSA